MSFKPPDPTTPSEFPPRTAPLPGMGAGGTPPPPGPFGTPAPGGFPSSPSPLPGTSAGPNQFGGSSFGNGGLPYGSPKKERNWGVIVLVVLLCLGPIAGIGYGVWAWNKSEDKADEVREDIADILDTLPSATAPEFTIPDITIPDITVPQITVPQVTVPSITIPDFTVPQVTIPNLTVPQVTIPNVSLPDITIPPFTLPPGVTLPPVVLFEGTNAVTMIDAFETAISGDPTRFARIMVYPEYAFAAAQDVAQPNHIDEFPWRNGAVGTSAPVEVISGEIEPALFTRADVDWALLPAMIAAAPGHTAVEEPEVTHVIIERSELVEGYPVTVKMFVSGPRAARSSRRPAQASSSRSDDRLRFPSPLDADPRFRGVRR